MRPDQKTCTATATATLSITLFVVQQHGQYQAQQEHNRQIQEQMAAMWGQMAPGHNVNKGCWYESDAAETTVVASEHPDMNYGPGREMDADLDGLDATYDAHA